jgi:phosphate-selective porin OprO and OprP
MGLTRRRVRAGWATLLGSASVAIGAGQAFASDQSPSPAGDGEALRAEVAHLTVLLQDLERRDQAQIQALSAQVSALQARLDQAPVAAGAGGQALPRAMQNQPQMNGVAPVAAQGAEPPTDKGVAQPRVVQNAARRFELQSADGKYSIGLTGDVQFDSGVFPNFHPDSRFVGPQALSNGVNARRARIGVTGTAGGNFAFAFVYDAGNSSDQTASGIETAQIIYNGLRGAAFELGYSNTFFTLDRATGSNDTLFMERASPSNIATNFNAGDNRANAGVRFFGDRYWIGGYLTGPASGDSHTQTGERFGAFERVAVQALKGPDYTLHLGFGFDQLIRAPNTGYGTANVLTLSDQPQLRIDPTTLLSTGVIGTSTHPVTGGYVLDVETAATFRNFFWQGEYYSYQVDRLGVANANFDGGYGELSWILTGENHRYNPQAASYFRISPRHPFSFKDGGWGAWELAARVSYVDLNSNFMAGQALSKYPAAVDGGIQRGYSVALSWYPNDLIRFILDYERIVYSKTNGTAVTGAPLGVPVGSSFDAIALRAQVAY